MTVPQRLVLGLVVFFALAAPARADFIDVGTEVLDDGWVRYTYTIEDAADLGLQSFVLTGEHFDEVRAVTQPADWMGSVIDDHLSWSRDVYTASNLSKKKKKKKKDDEPYVFSFESPHLPDLVTFKAKGLCVNKKGEIVGPGPDAVGTPSTTKTPEPTSLALLALGGVCWGVRQRFRREPA
jgi:hypothetical protein